MTREQILPAILIVIDVGSSVVYGIDGDARKCVYWLAAAVLSITVTF